MNSALCLRLSPSWTPEAFVKEKQHRVAHLQDAANDG
jgi:hypothetical protein